MRSTFVAVSAWTNAAFFLFSLFASVGLADVRFTEPSAGSNLTAGQIGVRWDDSGISPPISELTQYTLSLMVGGNDNEDMQPVSTFKSDGTYATGNTASGTIPEGIAADVPNGFFFRMTSTREAGGVLINYSNRFSIAGLSGDTALMIKQAAQALDGNTDGPPAVGNDASSSSSSVISTSSSTRATSSLTATMSGTSTQDLPTASVTTTVLPDGEVIIDDDEGSRSGLSKGATAAIAVAVTIAVIAICAAMVQFLCVRRRKKHNEVQEIAPGTIFPPLTIPPMSELSAENLLRPKTAWTHQTELSSDSMLYEAGSGERPPELDHMAFRAELEGSTPCTPISPRLETVVFPAELKGSLPCTPISPMSRL